MRVRKNYFQNISTHRGAVVSVWKRALRTFLITRGQNTRVAGFARILKQQQRQIRSVTASCEKTKSWRKAVMDAGLIIDLCYCNYKKWANHLFVSFREYFSKHCPFHLDFWTLMQFIGKKRKLAGFDDYSYPWPNGQKYTLFFL